MGRSRKVLIGTRVYRRDKPKPKNIENLRQLDMFISNSPGPVAAKVVQSKLIAYDDDFNLIIPESNLRAEIDRLKAEVVSAREYSRPYAEKVAVEITGLSATKALNAEAREYAARAQAVYTAARAAGVKLAAADKRILTPLANNKFYSVVYGSEGQFDRGTILSRMQKVTKYATPEAKARAAEKARELREYRYGDQSSNRYS